jgi:Na+-driven multidrug efflux pump
MEVIMDNLEDKDKITTKPKLGNREEILNGPIIKTIMKLAWPIMVGNTMHVIYNLADTFWLGKLGAEAVAAISIGFPPCVFNCIYWSRYNSCWNNSSGPVYGCR